MQTIYSEGSFDAAVRDIVNANFAGLAAGGFTGNVYYLDPKNGSDGNSGLGASSAFGTLANAYAQCASGHNDVIVLIGDGATGGTVRLTANFTWAKNATHLFGVCSPVMLGQRARIAPAISTTAFANFFTVSGNGCLFSNVEFFQGFDTGAVNEICLTVSGQRNAFVNCQISGLGDAASALDTGSHDLLLTAGENYFNHCTIGLDTVKRTNAVASVLSTTGAARNVFEGCLFIVWSGDGSQYFFKAGAAGIDRFVIFKSCDFISAVGSAGTAIAEGINLAAGAGGIAVIDSNTGMFGVTAVGGVSTKALTYVSGATSLGGVRGIVAS